MAQGRVKYTTGRSSSLCWSHGKGLGMVTVHEMGNAYTMAGKLLTTPSRLLKLIIPLTTMDTNTDRKDVQPLALLGKGVLRPPARFC